MDKIPSFQKNHDLLRPGFYFSGAQLGADTYDLRFKRPNEGDFISPKALHSIEHMLATALRNGEHKEHILYFGPMGCRTGFYLLTADLTCKEVFSALKAALKAALAMDEVPGSAREECGNYLEHDLADAKREFSLYLALLNSLTYDDIAAQETKRQEAHA